MRECRMGIESLTNKINRLYKWRVFYSNAYDAWLQACLKADPQFFEFPHPLAKAQLKKLEKRVDRIDKWRGRLELRLRSMQIEEARKERINQLTYLAELASNPNSDWGLEEKSIIQRNYAPNFMLSNNPSAVGAAFG
jgi:hypothetical protein